MARMKNSTFQGSPPADLDPHRPSFARVMRNLIGDLALIYDKLTGENGEANTIKHDGSADRGCLLGYPWINQTFGGRDTRAGQWSADLGYTSAPSGAKGGGSFGNDTIVFGVPVFVPAGERDMTVRITGRGLDVWPWRVELMKESDASILYSGELRHRNAARYEALELTTHDNGTDGAGVLCLLLVYADTTRRQAASGTTPDGQIRAFSLFAGPTRIRSSSTRGIGGGRPVGAIPVRRTTNDFGVTSPGGNSLKFWDLTAGMVADLEPLSSVITAQANRNENGLYEYTTGWPAGGNASYVQADSADNNPGTSRFMSHAKAGMINEAAIDLPLWGQAFGAFMLDGNLVVDAAPPTKGMMDWYAEVPIATAVTAHWSALLQLPDFATGANSRLKACVLAGSNSAVEGAKWKSSWKCGTALASTAQAFASVAGTKLMTSKAGTVGLINYNSDVNNQVDLRLEKTAAKVSVDELAVMGACLYFERD